jgi:hypothetical protein
VRPSDEYTHDTGSEATFNESMYVNLYDPVRRVGGFFRVGNRPNEGHAEVTVCLFLPDGRVAFTFARPEIRHNRAFDAAGMRFEVIEPFERLEVSHEGQVSLLDDPLKMSDPKRAFGESPRAMCTVRLVYHATAPVYAHSFDDEGESFAPNHYEQLVRAEGTIRVGEEEFAVDGLGLRDHSWGPRLWQTPWYYRWLIGVFGPDFGFMGAYFGRPDGSVALGGFVWDGQELRTCERLDLDTTWTGQDAYHSEITLTLHAQGREWKAQGRVLSLIPLRNRRAGPDGGLRTTRICEGLTRWTLADGRIGHGLTEYLDQIVGGRPVGMP